MCGGDDPTTLANRFGALAALSPTPSCMADKPASARNTEDLSGNIVFYNRESPDSLVATHMKFITSNTAYTRKRSNLQVGLHSLGDLTLPASLTSSSESPIESLGELGGNINESLDVRLKQPLYLHVGDDAQGNTGIIGRRISLHAAEGTRLVAEGIVGYNHLPRQAVL